MKASSFVTYAVLEQSVEHLRKTVLRLIRHNQSIVTRLRFFTDNQRHYLYKRAEKKRGIAPLLKREMTLINWVRHLRSRIGSGVHLTNSHDGVKRYSFLATLSEKAVLRRMIKERQTNVRRRKA